MFVQKGVRDMPPFQPSQLATEKLSLLRTFQQIYQCSKQWFQKSSFSPPWLPAWAHHLWVSYSVTFIVLSLTTTIGLLLYQFLPDFRTPGLLELAAVTFISANWGLGAGLFATMLGAISLNILLLPPFYTLNTESSSILSTLLFFILGALMSIGAYKVESARRQSHSQVVSLAAELFHKQELALQERAVSQVRELALLETNRRMDEFLSMAAHELRTPLTVIKTSVQFTRRGLTHYSSKEAQGQQRSLGDLNKYTQILERAEHNSKIQERMINDLLDAARLQTDHLKLQRASTDLLHIVQQTLEDQRALTPERQIILQIASPRPLLVYVDKDRIQQVLTNLLTNALKYSAKAQPVTVQVEQFDQVAYVSVIDQGEGIAHSEQKQIWERFYRVERASTAYSSSDGLGLGLFICHQIVQLHQGQIGVRSTVGEGSTFWFTLPAL